MRRAFLLASLVSLALAPASVLAKGHDATKGHEHSKSTPTTISGCLSGPNAEGVFELKTHANKMVEVGGLSDLKSHVGHEVRLTGTWVKSGAEIGENESQEAEAKEHKTTAAARVEKEKHLKVSAIQHVAETCTPASK